MPVSEAVELAKAHAAKWDIPWLQILESKKHSSHWIPSERYDFIVDTGKGKAIVMVDVETAKVGCFEYYPDNENDWMIPPWAAFPQFTSVTINWRMAPGQGYWTKWHDWYRTLPLDAKEAYRRHFPPPEDPDLGWPGFYEITERYG